MLLSQSQTIQRAVPANRLDNRKAQWGLAGIILLLELVLSSVRLVRFPGPSRYFAFQWTISYAHGLSRRGLLGTLLRLAHLDNGNFLLITFLGWIVTFWLFYVLAEAVISLFQPFQSKTGTALMVALLFSPATLGTLVCTTSDPVQITLLILFLLITNEFRISIPFSFLFFAALGAVSVLIHEATVFFLGPVLLVQAFILRKSRQDLAAFCGYLVGALPVLAWIMFSTQHRAAAVLTPLHFFKLSMVADPPITMDTFSQLLAQENAAHFHSGVKGYILTFRNALGAIWLPAFFTIVLGQFFALRGWAHNARRWYQAAAVLLVLNAPLWLIAHDWGRFTSYLFVSLLVLKSVQARLEAPASDRNASPAALPAGVLAALLVLAGVANSPEFAQYYNIKGLGSDNDTFVAAIIVSLVAAYLLFRRPRFASLENA